jgi:protein-tyrosine phosphatase
VLAATGVEPEQAIAVVRAARPGAIETAAQERFVSRFRDAFSEQAPGS